MPSKVQLKLLSNSGELLNVVTCGSGKIGVLRASSPNDLRPYQRALGGSSAKDNLEVVVDGSEYRPDQHTLIGFGEPSPTAGLSVIDYLTSQGISELTIDSLLLSIGLEGIASKRCAELSTDQEARLRLVAATTNPDKVLVLNDPFEHIASQWRERTAEMLTNYARSRRAIIIIPALSYRPECWIDNETIERIEVGQTSQRTIGFGSAGSQSNTLINELRDKIRQDPRFSPNAGDNNERSLAAAAGIGVAIGAKDLSKQLPTPRASLASKLIKAASIAIGIGVGGWLAVSFPKLHQLEPKPAAAPVDTVKLQPKASEPIKNDKAGIPAVSSVPVQEAEAKKPVAPEPARVVPVAAENKTEYMLDLYPALIKTSLIDTVRGVEVLNTGGATGVKSVSEKPAQPAGNLFSLLEKAGSKTGGAGASRFGSSNDEAQQAPRESFQPEESDESQELTEEEQRREEIRNRFLEAIRASAARRQAAMESEGE